MAIQTDILKGRKYTRSKEVSTLRLNRHGYIDLLKRINPVLGLLVDSGEFIVNGIRVVVDDDYPPKGEDYCDGK